MEVFRGAVRDLRAGIAARIASTTRFIAILVSATVPGAILAIVARDKFVLDATRTGFTREAAACVTSGDHSGVLAATPSGVREARRSTALAAHERTTTMTHSAAGLAPHAQAVVAGDLDGDATLTGRAGPSEFPIGGPDGRGGTAPGPNPYDLLSASLAACTAMTIRLHARHKGYPLSHVEVAVSYHHAPEGGRGSFERSITLSGTLDDDQRAQLLRGADLCPVGKVLGLSADIRTSSGDQARVAVPSPPASYAEDLEEYSVVNIDPD